jgi:membrane protein
MGRLVEAYPHTTVILIYVFQLLITLIVEALLFAFIFKVLPDAVFQWKHVWPGALFAAVFFMIGKFLIGLYLNNANVSSSYGSAGSLIVLMLWIYYSSAIFYFGALFTKAYIIKYGPPIVPKPYAVIIRVVEHESGMKNIQENEKEG